MNTLCEWQKYEKLGVDTGPNMVAGTWQALKIISSFLFWDWKGKRLGKEGKNEGRRKPTDLPAYLTCKSTLVPLFLFQVSLYVPVASLTCVSSQTQLSALPSGHSFCFKPSYIRCSNHVYSALISNTLQNISQSF